MQRAQHFCVELTGNRGLDLASPHLCLRWWASNEQEGKLVGQKQRQRNKGGGTTKQWDRRIGTGKIKQASTRKPKFKAAESGNLGQGEGGKGMAKAQNQGRKEVDQGRGVVK
jgi:hypothetical protein